MKNRAVVCIDMGSAYTKVAYRLEWSERATIINGTSASLEMPNSFCLPSTVARTFTRDGRLRWLIGRDAASRTPESGVEIFRNWKSGLFSESSSAAQRSESEDVAIAFLKELRLVVRSTVPDLADAPARIAVPKLNGTQNLEVDRMMRRLLFEAGWTGAQSRCAVFEPESNAIGVLTRGRNATWAPKTPSSRQGFGPSMMMPKMLDDGLRAAFRSMSGFFRLFVTDIGAFTTDFGLVEFDCSLDDDDYNRPAIEQASVELGINQLDEAVKRVFPSDVKEHLMLISSTDWERCKMNLYDGKEHQVTIRNEDVRIGGPSDQQRITRVVNSFADKVVAARREFAAKHAKKLNEEALTGGGAKIQRLRERVMTKVRAEGHHVHDLEDPSEPDFATSRGAGQLTPTERDNRTKENAILVRTASALGGVSVFFEDTHQ